ncbi:sensor histidine kinase [Algoriphagus resistens]|uniref:sensor histidine kinase n=1 Tax=Algoriphagus resistens TaxID=1750590 RepID=UPI000716ADAE|nr:histidine kinase [Algoriphagus resistens]
MSKPLSFILSLLLVLALGFYLLYNGGLIDWLTKASWFSGAFLLISILAGLSIYFGNLWFKRIETKHGNRYALLLLLIWGSLMAYSYGIGQMVNRALGDGLENRSDGLALKGSIVGLILAILIVWINYSWISYARFSKKTIQHLRNERTKEELQYKLLRSQLTPHFLFNSFNTASNLIASHPEQAENYIRKLAFNFRHLVKNGIQALNTLEKELEIVENYMHLMKVRYGEKVILEQRIKQEVVQNCIPALAIQLLVENALKHNVASLDNPLKILITADQKQVVVTNTITHAPGQISSTGVGLKNLKGRYSYYGNMLPTIHSSEHCFYVNLPYISNSTSQR